MKLQNLEQHLFALYYAQTESFCSHVDRNVLIAEKELHHRVAHVVRLASGSCFILFNKEYHAFVTVVAINKKDMLVRIVSVSKNASLSPAIRLLLPLLKRQSLADAVYAAVETGVNEIQLISTKKVQRAWGGEQELERLKAIIIAACEQSKHYSVPVIKAPITLQEALILSHDIPSKIFYDAAGDSFKHYVNTAAQQAVVLVGPEGDLTHEEKQLVKEYSFLSIHLTPTILRSFQAVTVGIGLLRAVQ